MASRSTDNVIVAALLRLTLVVVATVSGCGEEIDVNLVLPQNSPCYSPQVTARSVLVRVASVDHSREYISCFAINSVLEAPPLHDAIASRGPLASGISTEKALTIVVLASGDESCKNPLLCFTTTITSNGKVAPMLAKCDKTGWVGCALPPPK